MANSFVRYTGNGSTTTYAIPFSYRSTDDITVTIGGVATTAFTYNGAGTQITFTSPPADQSAIQITRKTSQGTKLVDYTSGSVLTESDLDTDSDQAFFMSQEAIDTAGDVITIDNADFQWTAQSKRIKLVADPTGAQDVATKNYTDTAGTSQVALATTQATNAAASATSAASSATTATTKASEASTSATNAATSATTASTQATNAATSATAAASSATTATTKASEASTSASNAATSATNAGNSATAAATSETNAGNSATAAATSATNAGNSETAAATSATNAASSATAAASSATSASGSATTATTKAGEASTSATNAAASATTATTQASTATTKASEAATSATNAATSETNAGTSATNAATSATNAATSATSAATSFDNFDDRYLGSKSSDPTQDNDGDALVTGALYFNSSSNQMKVYSGSAWAAVAPTATSASDLTTGTLPIARIAADSITNDKLDNPGRRNLLINGNMEIAARGTSATGQTGSGYHTVDRWRNTISGLGTWSFSQSTDVPSGQGFVHSLKLDCTTADASPATGDYFILTQMLEGYDVQSLRKGTSNAASVTVSFWVKSTKTGTYILEFEDADNTRSISQSYTINSGSTWEKKTLTFAGDTTGAFTNDGNTSLVVNFWYGAGTDYTSGSLNTSWGTRTAANIAPGLTNLGDNTANELYITGVQLELGTVASDYEFLSYFEQEIKCARYCQVMDLRAAGWPTSATVSEAGYTYSFPMRTTPTITSLGGFVRYGPGGQQTPSNTAHTITRWSTQVTQTIGGGMTTNATTLNAFYFRAEAELT